tara:strand:- start:31 stop:327 length:297 start_codon:yes stop_codon:yes gene_type:complete
MGAEFLEQDAPVEPPTVEEVKKRGRKLFEPLKKIFRSVRSRSRRSRRDGPGKKTMVKKRKQKKRLPSGTLRKRVDSPGKVSASMKAFYSKKRTKFAKK